VTPGIRRAAGIASRLLPRVQNGSGCGGAFWVRRATLTPALSLRERGAGGSGVFAILGLCKFGMQSAKSGKNLLILAAMGCGLQLGFDTAGVL